MTRKWYATLPHPKMYPHTKFGIPTSKNIGDMDRTGKRDGPTDGRTVRLLYASQSSFGDIKMKPAFHSLVDEIAEPHPDMNNKVAAFTVSEKSSKIVHKNIEF